MTNEFESEWVFKITSGNLLLSHKLYDSKNLLDDESLLYMFDITYMNNIDVIASKIKVIEIRISFKNEPRNKEEYEKLMESSLKIQLNFAIIPV